MTRVMHHIVVTQENIDAARRNEKGHCPVARAIAHACPDARYINATRTTIKFSDVRLRTRYVWRTPRVAQRFIDNLDAYGTDGTKPFSFDILDEDIVQIRPMDDRPPRKVGEGIETRPRDPSARNALNYRPSGPGKLVSANA